MRRLPTLSIPPGFCKLPVSDRSAALLAELLLADDPAEAAEPLAEQLAEDPPLVLWIVLRAAAAAPWQPRRLADVAAWLAGHAASGALRWDPQPDAPGDEPQPSEADACAVRVAADLLLADAAALLAESGSQADPEETYLRGLLHGAAAWLTASGVASEQAAEACLPLWLAETVESAAARCVDRAASLLAGRGDASPASEADLEACRRRAAQGQHHWLEAIPGVGAMLPQLAARLARLADLEHRFQELLEHEKLDAMAEFAAGAGHEINNPLAVISGRAQYFLKEEADAERRRGLALISAQVRRAYEMIADMRLFARPPEPQPERLDLAAMVDALVEEMAPAAARQVITIVRTGQAGPLPVTADPAQLNVALRALLRNAQEAIGHDGHVEVNLAASDDEVRIRVSDDGPGVTSDQRRHLFDPFYSARQAGRGLGLGLSKCWRIVVTNHGGRIDVASQPGQGATFTITLPRGELR